MKMASGKGIGRGIEPEGEAEKCPGVGEYRDKKIR